MKTDIPKNEYPQDQNHKAAKKIKKPIVITLLVLIVTALVGGAFYLGRETSSTKVSPASNVATATVNTSEKWEKLPSGQKGFPISDANDSSKALRLYSLSKKEVVTLDKIKITSGSGESGKGSSDPIASSNLLYTAFIGDDANLWLLSNETLQTKKLTNEGSVTYINGWSPDSTKIAYYNKPITVGSGGGGDGPSPTTTDFKPQPKVGFYQIDIEAGTTTPLAAIEYSEGFIDNNRLLIKANGADNALATFNTKTMQSDQAIIKGAYGFGTGQYDFTSDGSRWTYTTSKHPTNDMRVVMGSFPQAASTEIEVGNWADFQFPRFSPDDSKIAYWKKEGNITDGVPNYTVWVYDVTAKTKAKYGTGQLVAWADSNTLLVKTVKATGLSDKLMLVDLITKQATTIHTF